MKKKEHQLFVRMTLFAFFIILALGLLVIAAKKDEYIMKAVDKKISNYIDDNYKEDKANFKLEKTTKKNKVYTKKIYNKDNKNLFFIITYKDKKISSTYKEDYLEGKTLISYGENTLNKDLKKNNKNSYYKDLNITIDLKLNDCSEIVKKKLLDNKFSIPIYTINDKRDVVMSIDGLNKEINKLHNYIKSIKLTPKYYNLTYNDSNNVLNTTIISFSSDIMDIDGLNIGKEIINNNKSVLEKYDIKVKKLN